jgi:hypothetical protein
MIVMKGTSHCTRECKDAYSGNWSRGSRGRERRWSRGSRGRERKAHTPRHSSSTSIGALLYVFPPNFPRISPNFPRTSRISLFVLWQSADVHFFHLRVPVYIHSYYSNTTAILLVLYNPGDSVPAGVFDGPPATDRTWRSFEQGIPTGVLRTDSCG